LTSDVGEVSPAVKDLVKRLIAMLYPIRPNPINATVVARCGESVFRRRAVGLIFEVCCVVLAVYYPLMRQFVIRMPSLGHAPLDS
jgi:hypothetical protein